MAVVSEKITDQVEGMIITTVPFRVVVTADCSKLGLGLGLGFDFDLC